MTLGRFVTDDNPADSDRVGAASEDVAPGEEFAAIQGLYRLIKAQQAEIGRLRALVEGD